MMKNSIANNVQNLSSRKLWSIISTSQKIKLSHSNFNVLHAAENELIARKEYQACNKFHLPH